MLTGELRLRAQEGAQLGGDLRKQELFADDEPGRVRLEYGAGGLVGSLAEKLRLDQRYKSLRIDNVLPFA